MYLYLQNKPPCVLPSTSSVSASASASAIHEKVLIGNGGSVDMYVCTVRTPSSHPPRGPAFRERCAMCDDEGVWIQEESCVGGLRLLTLLTLLTSNPHTVHCVHLTCDTSSFLPPPPPPSLSLLPSPASHTTTQPPRKTPRLTLPTRPSLLPSPRSHPTPTPPVRLQRRVPRVSLSFASFASFLSFASWNRARLRPHPHPLRPRVRGRDQVMCTSTSTAPWARKLKSGNFDENLPTDRTGIVS